jgi:alkaline phosphatase D
MTLKKLAQRRNFLKSMAALAGTAAVGPLLTACVPASFDFGVASGDPLSDRVIIWTSVTASGLEQVLVEWEVATDEKFRDVVKRGKTLTDESVGLSVKVDVTGLRPGKTYFYRFFADAATSPVGKTKTLPKGAVKSVKLAVLSCANYPAGYFHVYREVARRAAELDAVVHLGDYIYEYAQGEYASEDAKALDRLVEPEHEIVSLSDYRTRYAQYTSDPDLQALRAALPLIAVWDDHEVTNDTWKEGGENHNPGEGDFSERKAAAIQAYYEWIPIRETDPENRERIYRSFDFGDVASLHMLETRLIARDKQLSYTDYITATGGFDSAAFVSDLTNPERGLLGDEQMAHLTAALSASRATWQVLGQQVLMAPLLLPAPLVFQQVSLDVYFALVQKAQTAPQTLTPSELAILNAPAVPLNLDAWDGYPAAREKVLQTAVALNKNLISLAGDTHNAWASNLDTLDAKPAGVEFATSSVSSPGFEEYLPAIPPAALASALTGFIPTLKFAETEHRGLLIVSLTKTKAEAEWLFVDSVKKKKYALLKDRSKSLSVLPGPSGRRLV